MKVEDFIERESYPAVQFLRRHGDGIAICLGVICVLSGLTTSLAGGGWLWTIAGLVAGSFAWLLMKSYAELVRIIASTLLPE